MTKKIMSEIQTFFGGRGEAFRDAKLFKAARAYRATTRSPSTEHKFDVILKMRFPRNVFGQKIKSMPFIT